MPTAQGYGTKVDPISAQSQWYLNAQSQAQISTIKAQQEGEKEIQQINNQAAMDMQKANTASQLQYIEAQREADIAKIAESSKLGFETLKFEQDKFNQVLAMYKDAFGDLGNNTGVTVPDEFNRNIDLFAPGGQYGAGAKAEVAKSANQALAAGQIGLASSGMSSGTNAAGLAARIGADAGLANAKIEDARVAALSGALTAKGQANLTAQQLKTQRDSQILSTLSSLA